MSGEAGLHCVPSVRACCVESGGGGVAGELGEVQGWLGVGWSVQDWVVCAGLGGGRWWGACGFCVVACSLLVI